METSVHHHHHHHHAAPLEGLNRAFVIGISLNALFVLIEVVAGFYSNSLALLTDAGHNLSDVASLALSLLAFRLLKSKPTDRFTYGYGKTTVIVTLLNAIILLVAIGSIGYEAAQRVFHPEPLPGPTIVAVAAVGIVINGFTAFLFMRNKERDLNVKGAYLHLMADALVSIGVVISGIIIIITDWYWMDSVISFVIMIVILFGTWSLLRDSLRLSLDGVPLAIDTEKIRSSALSVPGVKDIHHLHIWAISTTENALTAHLKVDQNNTMEETEKIKQQVKHELAHLNIQHATLEMESDNLNCTEEVC